MSENEENNNERVDIEEYAKLGKKVPKASTYKIRIDREKYDVDIECMTGRELLVLAGKIPEKFRINQKLKGGEVKKIGYDESVCFTDPGVERFMTLPLDPTEG